MTEVLLTGAGGFVGSHVLAALLERTDVRVICTDSFRHNGAVDVTVDAIHEHDAADWHRVRVLTHDLVAPFSRRKHEDLADVKTIIHVASRSQVDESIDEPVDFVLNNVTMTLRVLELARTLGARVIQMSTDEVLGERGSCHRPSSPYAASKAAQEDICAAWRRTYGLDVQVVRSGNLVGERQSTLAFVPKILRAIIHDERLQVHRSGGHLGQRWYTYVRNVADHIVIAATSDEPGFGLPPLHSLRGQHRVDNRELVRLVGELAGKMPEYELVAGDQVRPGYDESYEPLPFDTRWRPTTSFEDGLDRTVRWFLKNPRWLEEGSQ